MIRDDLLFAHFLIVLCGFTGALADESVAILDPATFRHWVDDFNRTDEELYPTDISNANAWEFLAENVPLFSCPDQDLERTYWFRWWTYRKHICHTPDGFIITEFLPKVPWSGKHNAISCPLGHHFREGRWLHDPKYLNDYAVFWLRKGGALHAYSNWIADSIWQMACVTGDQRPAQDLLPDLIVDWWKWQREQCGANGLYWQDDGKEGGEVSIGGNGYRPATNSYQYGDALAIARIAEEAGDGETATAFDAQAQAIRHLVIDKLWDERAEFFKVRPRGPDDVEKPLVDVRELHGLTPWYFDLPDPEQSVAWKQVMDPEGFWAPFGPTTTERRHPRFALNYYGHECQWNGPSWPFATSIVLTGMANLLNGPEQHVIGKEDYLRLLCVYANSHRLRREDSTIVPWIDENLNPFTGDWISRTCLKTAQDGTWSASKGGKERGKDYNHSTFCDLVITGLCGLRPRADDTVEVNPLLPNRVWDWFCLDRIRYHGKMLTIIYDRTGLKYGKGVGLHILSNGAEIGNSPTLSRIAVTLH